MTKVTKGRILRVNLTTGTCHQELLSAEIEQSWLGGRVLGTALLSDFSGCDPLDSALPLVLTTGPLCNTPVPMSTRCVLTGRSPLTSTIFSCTSGGAFAHHLKRTGYAALVLEGASAAPCLLEVTPDGASVVPAPALKGLDVSATFRHLNPFAGAAVIGPAGENGVRYASVATRAGESFIRGGLGAVMGRKGLKAIMVQGEVESEIANPSAFDKALEDLMRLFRASPFLFGPFGIRNQGTTNLVDLLAHRGMLPGKNFLPFSDDCTRWNTAALRDRFKLLSGRCHDCLVACKRQLPDGYALPEYDALAAFGGLCGVTDCEEIIAVYRQCHELGLDPVSSAASLATWSEITGQELSTVGIPQLLSEIAGKDGRGELLAQGAEQLAVQLGQPEKAMTVKGLELPPYDPRASTALALGYATSPHGGSHLAAWPIASEILRKPVPTDRFSFDGKARIVAMFEDANAAVDSLVLCRFTCSAVELEELAAILAAVTGEGFGASDLLRLGRATIQRERSFNRACGFYDRHDTLPQRFFNESANGLAPLDKHRFEQELAAYHRIRAAQ